VFCLLMGLTSNSLGATMAILVVFSIFCQQSCGLSFGIVPFVSKRSTGLVSGFVGSGGNVGGAVTQVSVIGVIERGFPGDPTSSRVGNGLLLAADYTACVAQSIHRFLMSLPGLTHWLSDRSIAASSVLLPSPNRLCSSPTLGCPPKMGSSGWV